MNEATLELKFKIVNFKKKLPDLCLNFNVYYIFFMLKNRSHKRAGGLILGSPLRNLRSCLRKYEWRSTG